MEEAPTSAGIFHFNPEYDLLHIHLHRQVKDTLIDFLYRLKTMHDPRRIGLLNLAMDLNDLNRHDLYRLQSSNLDAEVRKAFVDTLTQLHEVFFVSNPLRAECKVLACLNESSTSEGFFSRSLPIMSWTPTFERLHRDPRPIDDDLRQVHIPMTNLLYMLHLWLQLLKRRRVTPPQIEYRLLLAFDPILEGDIIRDRSSAKRWLQKENATWNERFLSGGDPDADCFNAHANYKDEDLGKAVKPAFGFWLFPVDALGPLQDEGFHHGDKTILDIARQWPELGLPYLP